MKQRATASDSERRVFECERRIDCGHERLAASSQSHDHMRDEPMCDQSELRLSQAQDRWRHDEGVSKGSGSRACK